MTVADGHERWKKALDEQLAHDLAELEQRLEAAVDDDEKASITAEIEARRREHEELVRSGEWSLF